MLLLFCQGPVMCVAEIMSVAPHPKADRLRVVQVLISYIYV